MKFRCERDVLADALGSAARAVSGRGASLPVLAGVRAVLAGDRLELTGSDLDLTITVELTVAGDEDGTIVIPAKLITDVVKALEPGAVTLATQDDQLTVEAGRSEFSLRLIPADEFPQLPSPPENAVTIDAATFAAALRQVVTAASSDDSRPILTGVLLAAEGDGLRLVATDSYRLSVRDLAGTSVLEEGQSVLVPSRALQEVIRLLDPEGEVVLRLGDRDVTFEVGGTRLSSRLIEGDFPNYRGLIPDSHPNLLTVSREVLLDALRRVKLMAREATPVRLSMSDGQLELVAVTQDVGQAHEAMDAQYNGAEMTVAFNPDYLFEGVEASVGDEVVLRTIDELKPALLSAVEDDGFLYLLMPVRVS